MRILLISDEPIKMDTSVGNTFLNLFSSIEDIELASICTRNGSPDNVIKKCYCITEKMIIKSIFNKSPAGMIVSTRQSDIKGLKVKSSSVLNIVKKLRWSIFFWIQNLVWKTGKWKNDELNDFVNDFEPDVIFTYLSNCEYLNYLILHIKKISGKKLVVYAWDNNYSLKQFFISPLRWIRRMIERIYMRKVVNYAEILYVISNIQKAEYEKVFKRECKLLTKSADFNVPPEIKKHYNNPIQLVYTGNIGLNRWKSLAHIANVLEKMNADDIKVQLRIYTGNILTDKMNASLNKGESSFVMGSVTADKVIEIQKNADILVHVETFDLKNKLIVKQSFSTKIVDYLVAARPIIAFGPKDVASIDHFVKNDCAIVADSEDELLAKLTEIIENKDKLNELAVKAFECGKKFHNKDDIENMLRCDIEQLMN